MSQRPDPTPFDEIAAWYRAFAENEARGVSPLYEALALHVAGSEALLRFLSTLPREKQQPNLLFGAVRHLYGTPRDPAELESLIGEHEGAIRTLMLSRRTQTNEPGRCATLLPVLARCPGPIALIEVGAAAGLCLLPDLYGYDYGRLRIGAESVDGIEPPVFPCRANDATPLPDRLPQVVWRAGIDLNPVDLRDPDDARWLESLVWPGQEERAERLRRAMEIARRIPIPIRQGNLLTELDELAAAAPADATLVVFHSAVLAYLAPADRERFVDGVRKLDATWISNEARGVFPEIDRGSPVDVPLNRFVLSIDGAPLAFTGPHGQSIDWIGPVPAGS